MDQGHYNCRDYYISPNYTAAPSTDDYNFIPKHESFDELERRSRSPEADKPRFPLLRLPLELRQHILSYILPHTREFKHAGLLSEYVKKRAAEMTSANQYTVPNVWWIRGNIKIMAVCKQLHQECAELVYGSNIFLLHIEFREIKWTYRWQNRSGHPLSRERVFLNPKIVPTRYLHLVRRVVVRVDVMDDYMAMVHHNVSGKGYFHGLRRQVHRLVLALGAAEQFQADGTADADAQRLVQANVLLKGPSTQQKKHAPVPLVDFGEILQPFGFLRGIRNATVGGDVQPELAADLVKIMKSDEPCDPDIVGRLPDEGMSMSNTAGGVQLCVYGNDI